MELHVSVRFENSIVVLSRNERHRLWIYNLWTEHWTKYDLPRGKLLPVENHQRGVQIGSAIYMSGGTNMVWKLMKCRNNLFTYKRIQIKDHTKKPSPRHHHCAWEYDKKMWIFGGYGIPPDGYINNYGDFTRDFTHTGAYPNGFHNQLLSYEPFRKIWTDVACSGDVPAPQARASAALLNDKVYLHGGYPSNIPYRGDLYELDMPSITWTRIKPTGLRPNGRMNFSLISVTINHLVFYGGPDGGAVTRIFDVQLHTWKEYSEKKIAYNSDHTGTTGLHGSVVIIGRYFQPEDQLAYTPTVVTLRLEPKSLQQLAMQMIYHKVDSTLWETLPKKLLCKMIGTV